MLTHPTLDQLQQLGLPGPVGFADIPPGDRASPMARARIAVARKLAAILHRMWAEGAELRCGKDDAAIAA